MKKFYFVRHGESEGNITDVHYDPQGPLTEEGRKQALFLAERFTSIPVDVILASHYERAQQTAEIVSEKINKSVETVELLSEKDMPSFMVGMEPEHPKRVELSGTIQKHFLENYKHSDEESFEDLKERALQLLDLLLTRKETDILLVTHGWFLRIVIGVMMMGNELTGEDAFKVWGFLKTKNTGVTLCTYDEKHPLNSWQMVTWMDHAHLGEVHP